MYNASTMDREWDRPTPVPDRWWLLAIVSFFFHAGLTIFVTLPKPVPLPVPAPKFQTIDISATLAEIPAVEFSDETDQAPSLAALAQLAEAAKTTPLPLPSPEPEVAAAPPAPAPAEKPPAAPPLDGKAPEPEKLVAPTTPAVDLPEPEAHVADDTARGMEKPPEKPKYLGATNTEAADHSSKEKLGDDPHLDGKSGEILFAGRRGETGKSPEFPDPLAGSVQKQGTPLTGRPAEIAAVPSNQPRLEKKSPPLGPLTKDAGAPATPVDAKAAAKPPAALPPAQVLAVRPEFGQVALSVGSQDGAEPGQVVTITHDGSPVTDARIERVYPDMSVARLLDPKADVRVQDVAVTNPHPSPETNPLAHPRDVDPELARVMALLDQTVPVTGGPENDRKRTGMGTREGAPGQEGDGRVRPGESDAVSDIETVCLSSASREGDVAFSKQATPELAYLKSFFQRMDGKWKAVFFSNSRAISRLEFGQVRVRFALAKDGALRQATELERQGTVSDQAVEACLEGIRRAAPHEPFPSNLAGKEQISMTITFLYR